MSNSTGEHCKFFVQRKKRYCKMSVKPGRDLCGEHQKTSSISEIDLNGSSTIRIVCPLDRKHTVYAHNLNKHLKMCNARQGDVKPYIEKDVNSGKSEIESSLAINDSFQLLSSFPKDQILAVIDKINHIYEEEVKLLEKMLGFPVVEEEMKKPEYGDRTKKHLKQASAIIGLLEEYGLLKEKTCYIEFGAGRGQLSFWIAKATEGIENSKLLLVERASPKHKRDNKLANTTDQVQRIRADIADLVLDKVDVFDNVEHIVGVSKHLCGEATDLAVRCLTNPEVNKDKVCGALFTFCCHHRCLWTPYIGKKFFEENNLSIEDFNIMCGLSSWATSGTGFSREYREKLKDKEQPVGIEAVRDSEYGLSRAQREGIGRKCKNIINWGRLKYLERKGFKCVLHYYVEKNVTLENVCIVALKEKSCGH